MPNQYTLYLAKDDSGIFLFNGRPAWEPDGDVEGEAGIWVEGEHGKLLLQLTNAECQDMFGFVPELETCHDITVVSTLIERIPA